MPTRPVRNRRRLGDRLILALRETPCWRLFCLSVLRRDGSMYCTDEDSYEEDDLITQVGKFCDISVRWMCWEEGAVSIYGTCTCLLWPASLSLLPSCPPCISHLCTFLSSRRVLYVGTSVISSSSPCSTNEQRTL